VFVLCIPFLALADHQQFPLGPNDPGITPGKLCDHPDEYRYPEKIPYCKRDVSKGTKNQVIKVYDQQLGYEVEKMDRQDFKIDHYIPLCAGGANDKTNLWPQHKSVYAVTDPLEPLVCDKMAQGRLLQVDAIRYIREAKADLSKAQAIIDEVSGL
jgi:hypothetical protein